MTEPSTAASVASNSEPQADPKRWYVLGMLVLIYATMHMDRQIVTLLLEPIKHEFDLSDSQLGFLAGMSFAIAFSAAGIPLGMLVDRVHRVRLLAVLMTIWSGLTAVCAMAGSFTALVAARIGIGAAESGGGPTSSSLIGDYFGRRERPLAFGIYHTGTQIGSIIGFAGAALVAQAYGWRMAFLLAGIPGLLLMLVVLMTLREPRRGAMEPGTSAPAAAPGFGETVRFLLSQRAQVHTFAGFVIAMMVISGLSAWLAPLMMRSHGVSLQTAGLAMAFGISSAGVVGALAGGWLASKLGVSKPANLPRITAFAMLLSVPAAIVATLADDFSVMVGGFAIQLFANSMVTATGFSLVLEQTQTRMRGTTMALLLVLTNIFGYGLGPQIVGWLSDGLSGRFGADALAIGMVTLALFNLWGMLHMLAASRHTAADIERAQRVHA